jgi:hypothetical protein
MAESGEGFHSPAFGVNRNREAPLGGLGCVANRGVISGRFGSVAMLGLSGCFFGSVARKELRGFWGLVRASGTRKVHSAPRQARGKLAGIEGVKRTARRASMVGRARKNRAELTKPL